MNTNGKPYITSPMAPEELTLEVNSMLLIVILWGLTVYVEKEYY